MCCYCSSDSSSWHEGPSASRLKNHRAADRTSRRGRKPLTHHQPEIVPAWTGFDLPDNPLMPILTERFRHDKAKAKEILQSIQGKYI